MRAYVITALLAVLGLSPAARADAELVAELEVRVLKAAETELGKVEKQLRVHPDLKAGAAANITLPLQTAIEAELGKGAVKISPRAIFEACLIRLRRGEPPSAVGAALVEMYRKGELARPAAPPAQLDATLPNLKADNIRKVASFVFDKERVRSPDPHLPSSFSMAPGSKVKGVYTICVDTQGKVTKVATVQSISGADQAIMEQLQSTWVYKPQPVPVCTTRAFVFQFN